VLGLKLGRFEGLVLNSNFSIGFGGIVLIFPKLEVSLDFYIREDCGLLGSHLNTVASPGVGKFLKF
jgi:hypothetical protein